MTKLLIVISRMKFLIQSISAKEIRKKIFEKGVSCYQTPDLKDIRNYCKNQVEKLWDEVKRFENPHNYYVDLSQKLWQEKQQLISDTRKI